MFQAGRTMLFSVLFGVPSGLGFLIIGGGVRLWLSKRWPWTD